VCYLCTPGPVGSSHLLEEVDGPCKSWGASQEDGPESFLQEKHLKRGHTCWRQANWTLGKLDSRQEEGEVC